MQPVPTALDPLETGAAPGRMSSRRPRPGFSKIPQQQLHRDALHGFAFGLMLRAARVPMVEPGMGLSILFTAHDIVWNGDDHGVNRRGRGIAVQGWQYQLRCPLSVRWHTP